MPPTTAFGATLPERIYEEGGDILLPLRRLRNRYFVTGNDRAALAIAALIANEAANG